MPDFVLSQEAANDLQDLRNHWRNFARENMGGGFSPAVHNSRIAEYVEVGELLDEELGLYSGTVQVLNADGLTWEAVSDSIFILQVALDPDDADHKPLLLTEGDLHIGLRFGTYQDLPVFAVDNCCGGKCREEAQCHNCNLLIWRFCGQKIYLKQSFDGCCCSGSGSGGPFGSGSGCDLCPTDNIPLRIGIYINGIGNASNLPDGCVSQITGGGSPHEDVCLVYQGIVNCNYFSTPFANCQWWTATSSAVGQIDLFSPECSGAWILKVGQTYFLPWSWIYAPCSCQFFGYYYPPNSANGNGVYAYSFDMCNGNGCGSGSGPSYSCWDCGGGAVYCSYLDLTSQGCTKLGGPFPSFQDCVNMPCGSGSGSGVYCYANGPDPYNFPQNCTCVGIAPGPDYVVLNGAWPDVSTCLTHCNCGSGSGSGSGSGTQWWCVERVYCGTNQCLSCTGSVSFVCETHFANGTDITGVGDSSCYDVGGAGLNWTHETVMGGPYSDSTSCNAVCGAGSGSG